jgi:Chaperone of endosialidase
MNTRTRTAAILPCVVCALGSAAHAAQPPDVVKSDSSANTAMGTNALLDQTTAYYNTGAGYYALFSNATGEYNTAFGALALIENTASYNTGVGSFALENNTTGTFNTANGYAALASSTTAAGNTAVGANSLYTVTTGSYNTAVGYNALQFNATSFYNTAVGVDALYQATGTNNIAIGDGAGSQVLTGSNNIDIGNNGLNESSTIRVGNSKSQTATYIAGIYGTQVTGSAVYITAGGQLGVLASSERFKTQIAPMGVASGNLQKLRPVTFQLKTDPESVRQFGLIAEEVDKIYPELVIRDGEGKIQGVRYEELAPMLLNELQNQSRVLQQQARELRELKQQTRALQASISNLAAKGVTVAMR